MKIDYWKESLASSFDEHGVMVTDEQLIAIAKDIQSSYECINLAFYRPENPLIPEVDKLKRELEGERNMEFCERCNGKGNIFSPGPYHSSFHTCGRCNGRGKHKGGIK